tara:strand:+ start:3187 stop:3513 length:327 start_codon:yes stop_codon:yes gene_type:complete
LLAACFLIVVRKCIRLCFHPGIIVLGVLKASLSASDNPTYSFLVSFDIVYPFSDSGRQALQGAMYPFVVIAFGRDIAGLDFANLTQNGPHLTIERPDESRSYRCDPHD